MLGNVLGNVDGITNGLDVGTYLVSLDVYFYCSNYGKHERLFLGKSLGYTDGRVLGSDEDINRGYFMVKCLALYLKIYMES